MKNKVVMFGTLALVALIAAAFISTAIGQPARSEFPDLGRGFNQPADNTLSAIAGPDRIVISGGKTYLNGFAGYGSGRGGRGGQRRGMAAPAVDANRPAVNANWSKESGPGTVTFENANAAVTTATFSELGSYVLKLTASNGETSISSTLNVTVEPQPPSKVLEPVYTKFYKINSPLWSKRAKVLIVNWIPHCIDNINNPNLTQGPGGIDNFIEAAKALKGEQHGNHKGYVFSNAWVHQTVESMCIALMIDPQGDQDIINAQKKFRATLEDWIPKILAAQESDGYLQTAFTLRNPEGRWQERWSPAGRGNHEGYVAGYFLESAINHYMMTKGQDLRLYNAAKKLADCWYNNLGPAPKKDWYDGHQEMEQALGRFGRFVNEVDGAGKGDKYIELAKFLLDCRRNGSEYDQSHVPVIQQYEAVGHAVRAAYNYSGMADVALGTHNIDYQSAVKSIWDNVVNRKYYITGGVGSGETSEGFGPNYSLGNNAYCESCSSCGEMFFQYKMNLMYSDAKYADLYEDTFYNALLGGIDIDGKNFYYQNPLDSTGTRYPWHGCPCCVGNIPRTLLMLPTWMYARDADSIYVNMFIGSTIPIENIAGTDVEVIQITDYPWNGKVIIRINPKVEKTFNVKIRMPNRNVSALYKTSTDGDGITSISVNGLAIRQPKIENGYAVITRNWRPNDRIELVMPLPVQRVKASEKIAADVDKVALRYGPMVYNIERVDQDVTKVLAPDSALTTEFKPELLQGIMVIKGTFTDGSPMTAIPNYARMNREPTASSRGNITPGMGLTGARGRGGAGVVGNPAEISVNLSEQLGLTFDQIDKLKLVGANTDAVQKLQEEMAAAQTELNTAAVETDSAKIKTAVDKITSITEKISLIRGAESRQVKSILNPEQWKQFQTAMTPPTTSQADNAGRGGARGARSIIWIRDKAPVATAQ